LANLIVDSLPAAGAVETAAVEEHSSRPAAGVEETAVLEEKEDNTDNSSGLKTAAESDEKALAVNEASGKEKQGDQAAGGDRPPNDDGSHMYRIHVGLEKDWSHLVNAALAIVTMFVLLDKKVSETDSGSLSTAGYVCLVLRIIASLGLLVEYALRLYSIPRDIKFVGDGEHAKYSGENWHEYKEYPRLCYAADFVGIVDFLSWAPFFLSLCFAQDSNARVCIGALQIVSVLKLDRKLPAFTLLDNVLMGGGKNDEKPNTLRMLVCTLVMSLMLWVCFASLLWIIEKGRTEMHGSFDTVPISLFHTCIFMGGEWDRVDLVEPWGELVGVVIAIAGIGIVGLPISIFFDGYSDITADYFQDMGLYDGDDDDDDDDDAEAEESSSLPFEGSAVKQESGTQDVEKGFD